MTKLYTKSGDDGTTALGGGIRVGKSDRRVEAYGTVDELNAVIGTAFALGLADTLQPMVESIQHMLFDIGADLAFSHSASGWNPQRVRPDHIVQLEQWIDRLQNETGELHHFILPGGSKGAAFLHIARTVCRRAERLVSAIVMDERAGFHLLQYLNRLSDLLFVMARAQNQYDRVEDIIWRPSDHGAV